MRAPARIAEGRPASREGWLALALAASALLHGAALAALLGWPAPAPSDGQGALQGVALVFEDTRALQGTPAGGAEAPAEPATATPPASPGSPAAAPPSDPAPPAEPEPSATAPPSDRAAPANPEPPTAARPSDPAAPAQIPASETPPAVPPDPSAEAAETAPAEAALPLPPPAPPPAPMPPPVASAAAPRPTPPTPVRLGAGAGALPDASAAARAVGAVVPPAAAPGQRNAPPDYPAESRRRGEEGVVRLMLRIDAEGRVVAAEVATSSGHAALDHAAREAARRWRFRPATQAGVAVAASLSTAVHFRLTDSDRR